MSSVVVEVKNLTKKFGRGKSVFTAVDDVSFSVAEGEILGLLGPNGAGKTTTVFVLLDILRPTSGEVKIFGLNHIAQHTEIMQQLNFSSAYTAMPSRLTVWENLYVFALLFNVREPRKRIEEVLRLVHGLDLAQKRYSFLSSGQRTRVSLAKALLNRPRLLLLDEPTASLDPEMAESLRHLLKKMVEKEKMTVIFTSHNMAEVEELCDRVVFINHGRVITTGSPLEVTQEILQEEKKEPDLGQVFLKIMREFGP